MDTSQCLTDEFLVGLIDGPLEPDERSRAYLHMAKCAQCREVVAVLLRDERHPPSNELLAVPLEAAGWTPPDAFDEFRMVQPLGRGSMGVVYLAHDLELDRQVAVKFIATARPDARARKRFQNEARAIARLQHPNVVTVYRVGEVQGLPYIVSEYLVGKSLLQMEAPLPWRRVLSLGIGLARGLAAAHRQGVLHRDLKPANIFLTSAEEVKLLDFGLAELINAGDSSSSRGARAIAGTPFYMAPELFQEAPATPQSDLYSLGLVLYELCAGWLSLTQGELFRRGPRPEEQRGAREPAPLGRAVSTPPLSQHVPGIDLDFASIIDRCLSAEPEKRFASAEALCAELERLLIPSEHFTRNPYRGLAPFEAEHRGLFFGRDAEIRAVLERLRRQPLVLVAGDSGVGKSSLCRAGIIPRVAQGALDERRNFRCRTLEPGRWPLAALAAALAPVLGCTEMELKDRFTATPQWLGSALRAAHEEGRGLLLCVDQLEELITLAEPAQAASFASLMGELALPSSGVRVLLAVRGDFLTRIGALPGLGDRIEQALYLLRPLSPEGARAAITGPARSFGVAFESEQLLQALIEATAREAGSLPLLQFTLAELWERRDRARACITREELDKIGGVAGALSRHADEVLARLERAGQQVARRLFGLLITAEGTRCERSEEELASTSQEVEPVLRVLVAGRLLYARAVEGRTSYEIAHEALITHWSTMRRWLDEDAGQRALRQRVEVSSTEWERSGRAADLLWRGRQLDETRGLDMTSLGVREQRFLKASQRAVRLQRLGRGLTALLFLLGIGGFYLGMRLNAAMETRVFVQKRMEEARTAHSQARLRDFLASQGREGALTLFSAGLPADSEQMREFWSLAEVEWDRALEEFREANDHYVVSARALESAISRSPDHPEARKLLLQNLRERLELAERFHREDERARLMEDFERLAAQDPTQLDWLHAPAELSLVTEPPDARVEISRYVGDRGRLRKEPVVGQAPPGATPIQRWMLPPGSYHLRIIHQDYVPIDLPLLLERGRTERVKLVLPAHVPEGYVYIPPGCFLSGTSDPELVRVGAMESAPLHRVCHEKGYLIGRHEVTLGDWIAYLSSLDKEKGKEPRRILMNPASNSSGRTFKLEQLADGTWTLTFARAGEQPLRVRAGEPFRYPGRAPQHAQDWLRFPLADVSARDVEGYLAWLDDKKLKGARLCSEWEWTRAARGADNRRFPHGDQLSQYEANIDTTYGRNDRTYGPDEVGSHPGSVSPFGLHDMAGNVLEMTHAGTARPEATAIVQRGGAWYYPALYASIASLQPSTPEHRDVRVGLRVCASLQDP
jgi:formylglycine-generating enzyme required for sulfatase activity